MPNERVVCPAADHPADARRHRSAPTTQALPARNTSPPQPATNVNNRGPKSRAGLISVPGVEAERRSNQHHQQADHDRRETGRRRELRLSVIPKMTPTSSAVPTT
jgi:hypothetical protein